MYKWLRSALIAIFLAVVSVYWFKLGGEQTVLWRNTLYLLFPFMATLSGVFALKEYGLTNKRTLFLVALTLGAAGLFIGEVIFFHHEFISHDNPFPSTADFFYLLSYPLFFFALLREIRQTAISWKSIGPAIRFLLAIVAVAIAIIVLYFGVFLAYDSTQSILANVIAMSYGIGDLGLIVADISVLVLAWEFRHGSFSTLWIRLFLSFIFMLLADILFALFATKYDAEIWFYKSLVDTFFILSYVFFTDGLLHFGYTILETKSKLVKSKMIGRN